MRFAQFPLWIFILIAVTFASLIFLSPHDTKTIPVQVGSEVFTAWKADTDSLRMKGLSGKTSMPSNFGMLFLFPEANYHTFWMKDMKFPLDFIWIRNHIIVDLTQEVPPPVDKLETSLPTYSPREVVNAVLEVNAGFVGQHGIRIGDAVNY
ncbi:DUF192 domain-containing protein [Candidatus Gottesmanbacteria bacterium]|nr:DUF192 domain-containing protein [Candidatus Gottesmanbacteria bacterium]